MSKADIDEWFSTEFWPAYGLLVKTPFPNDYGAGAKGKCLQSIEKLRPSKDLCERIIMAVHAQITHRKKLCEQAGSASEYNKRTANSKDRTLYSNRMGSTWINQKGYEDEIPSLSMPEQPGATGQTCKTCGKRPVIGPSFDKCDECYPFESGRMTGNLSYEMREYYKSHPEIAKFDRGQALNFIRNKARGIGK